MSFFDRFIKPASPAGPPAPAAPKPRNFSLDRENMFDLTNTTTLGELFAVPHPQRQAAWAVAFFTALWTASLEVATPNIFPGPDQFAYIRLQVPAPGKPFDSNCVANLAQQALDNIWGMAIFASPEATEPEYVLSMGLIDSLLNYDSWQGDPVDLNDLARQPPPQASTNGIQTFTAAKDHQILVGTPSKSLLPAHTARALYRHLTRGWNIVEPRVSLMMNPTIAPSRSLVLNRKLSEFSSREIAGQQGRFLLWYLPPNRGLIMMPESWNDAEMKPLTDFFPQV